MVLLGVALFVLVMTVLLVRRLLELNSDYRRVRSEGIELQAEVVDYDKRPGTQSTDFHLRPIVRYHLGERTYQGTVSNADGRDPLPIGSFTTVVVSPKTPTDPYDPYLGSGGAVWVAFGALAVALGLLAWAVARL